MNLSALITADKEFSASLETLALEVKKPRPLPIVVNGLTREASADYVVEAISAMRQSSSAPSVVVVPTEIECDKLCERLCLASVNAVSFKARDLIFYNISASHDRERERLSVLLSLLSGEVSAVVTTPAAASLYTISPQALSRLCFTLRAGDEISPDDLTERLLSLGLVRVELVEAPGQFARRGGIVDFYPSELDVPVRAEFFGDEIDRLVTFDILSQRAGEAISEAKLLPAVEVILSNAAKEKIKAEITSNIKNSKIEAMTQSLKSELSALEAGAVLLTRDRYLNLIYSERATLFSYLSRAEGMPASAMFIMDTAGCDEAFKRQRETTEEQIKMLHSRGLLSRDSVDYYLTPAEYKKASLELAGVNVNPFAGAPSGELAGLFGFRTRRTVGYGDNNNSLLFEDLNAYKKGGYRVIITAPNASGAESLRASLLDEKTDATFIEDFSKIDINKMSPGSIVITVGEGRGYDLISPKIALLSTERDEGARIMAERRSRRILKRVGGAGARLMSHNDLTPGDYVVHANYGIGLFEGIETVRALGVTKDYITIRYAGTDKLFIPCDKLDLISKYIGARASDGTVKLSKMGGLDWQRARAKARGATQDIAKHLLKLYAERQESTGFAFPADSELEAEFSAGFEYEETESQRVAIEEIKRDMMKPVPMNRLLLGDVGFGKTEVALRAAFKAIMGGKQVAILVPTTILALQHYQTALSRMRGYAVNIEMLSRFTTPKEVRRITEDLARGKTDILIGTHKLISKKIDFKRLGLLIVDEEQRFGVSQKEKLKEMAVGVDVLTLSATPIPRTLNMAINGISDMSVLDEPPGDRRPVQTYVMEYDEPVIFDAVRRELFRGGQVLYLYNNIETISFVASKIMREIPEARVAYAHGQMEREELEDIWQMLLRGEIDVLVSTTIIETGVDLPNANTLIIENADRMGLSQLHQIRGRVGRSERQAYAYFTYRPGKALSEVAEKRLAAIREYAEFGAGFKVALRDLEIRGAGNLLGAEQHGYIDSVGYDLYVKLLNQAVAEARGEIKEPEFESTVDIKVDAHIPEWYIASSAHRMEMYKRISDIRTPDDKEDVYDELTDRFGEVPKAVERLLSVALARAISEEAKISKTEHRGGAIYFYTERPRLELWADIFPKYEGRLYGVSGIAPIVYRLRPGEDVVSTLEMILVDYYNAKKAES